MDPVKTFTFSASNHSSKSLMNRALIAQSYFPHLKIQGQTQCEDVLSMKKSCSQVLKGLASSETFDVGEGGTTLRFLMSRLSRCSGSFILKGHRRLFERPHDPLIQILESLGAVIHKIPDGLEMVSRGWEISGALSLEVSLSSQYLSSLLLNAWDLPQDLEIVSTGKPASTSYLEMTLKLLQALGMEIQREGPVFRVPKHQHINHHTVVVEPDMSSCFAVSAFGALLGKTVIQDFPQASLQPDFRFLQILSALGVSVQFENSSLIVNKGKSLKGGSWDLRETPDLFPVLCILLSQCEGPSRISGVENLVYKESNRIEKTKELLHIMGVGCSYGDGVFHVKPSGKKPKDIQTVAFSPDQDHRMVMAAALACHLGFAIQVLDGQVVGKSFPTFFDVVGEL